MSKIKYDIVMITDTTETQYVYVVSNEEILNSRDFVLMYNVDSYYVANIKEFNLDTGNVKLECDIFIHPVHAKIEDCRKIICSNNGTLGIKYMSAKDIFDKYDN